MNRQYDLKTVKNSLRVLILLPTSLLLCQCSSSPKSQAEDSHIPRETLIEHRNTASDTNKVDILFVLNTLDSYWFPVNFDTRKRFESFIPIIDVPPIDWRMLFINSHHSEGDEKNGKAMNLDIQNLPNAEFLDRSVPNHSDVFVNMITKGLWGKNKDGTSYKCSPTGHPVFNCNYGHPLKALKTSFAANKHLTREEAAFLAIIISNREEAGREIYPDEIIEEFKKVYGPGKKFSVWALIIRPGDKRCLNSPEHIYDNTEHNVPKKHLGDYGYQIAELVDLTGGGEGDKHNICRDTGEGLLPSDYSDLAKRIITSATFKKTR